MLDFTLDQEQEMLERTIHRFAEERVRRAFRDSEERGSIAPALTRAGWEIGVLQTGLPEEYGGSGLGLAEAKEELARLAGEAPDVAQMLAFIDDSQRSLLR